MNHEKITASYKKEDPKYKFSYHDYSEKSFLLSNTQQGTGVSVHLPLGTCKLKKLNANQIEVQVPLWLIDKHLTFFTK